jgi:glucose-6-phosphate dehydrogenase assembly protein OpcA
MPATAEISNVGMPVEIGEIDRELKKLWEQAGGAVTRASLINLAVYSEEPDSLSRNTEIISKITEDLACRAIVISANRAAKENRVDAWISAHCHISRAGSKQVCSEQLSFSLEGPCVNLLPSIVFSHLDSDLPFYLWWQNEFRDPMDPQLWAWVDRLIYDSQTWSDFRTQMRLVEAAQSEAKGRVVLCDLNWARIVHVRVALAQFFDHPASHHHLAEIKGAEIDFSPGYRSSAVLLAGWVAAQLRWKMEAKQNDGVLQFRDQSGGTVEFRLGEKAGEPIGRCTLSCRKGEFRVEHAAGTDLLDVSFGRSSEERMHQLLPAGVNDAVALVGEELIRGGPHRIYLRAMNAVRELL